MGWVLMFVIGVLMCLGFKCFWVYLENTRKSADDENLLIQYVTCLHEYGVDSEVAQDFKLGCQDDETFLRRAQAMDEVFRMKDRVDRMWEGE